MRLAMLRCRASVHRASSALARDVKAGLSLKRD
jgi:hypothetical protein